MESTLTESLRPPAYSTRWTLDSITPYVRDLCRRAVTYIGLQDDDKVFSDTWVVFFEKGLHWPLTMLVLYTRSLQAGEVDLLEGAPLPCSEIEEIKWAKQYAEEQHVHADIARMFFSRNYEFQNPVLVGGKVLR